jgi:Ca-activated chloride channel family protein
MAYMGSNTCVTIPDIPDPIAANDSSIKMIAELVQNKILKGSDGKASVEVHLSALELPDSGKPADRPVDLVVVLDRSGSMRGRKLHDAQQAVLTLIDRLAARDRLALVAYSNGVQMVSPLVSTNSMNRQRLAEAVRGLFAGGGTNLGGGLKTGIETLVNEKAEGRQRKVILISDGLANHGITDPRALGLMASKALEYNFAISTVGVGLDFNEVLMTTIADHGSGQYYFLENPQAFAAVFKKEFQATRQVAASGLEIRIPLKDGIRLIHAAGYPIKKHGGSAVFHPGDLLSGQERKLFLTFQVPTTREKDFSLGNIQLTYKEDGREKTLTTDNALTIACVPDPKEVVASIDKKSWGRQVIQEDYNKLKELVADAIRKGQKDKALGQIVEYEKRNRALNADVKSSTVSENLDRDVQGLRKCVEETFAGPPAAVAGKQKAESKKLQFESYQNRRDKK